MKFSSIFVGALATVVAAAPASVEKEEKRNVGFGNAGFDIFGGAAQLGIGAPLVGFGQGLVGGNVFDPAFLGVGGFNQFAFQNQNLAYLFAINSFDFNTLFTLIDAQFAVNNLVGLFNFPGGDFLNLEVILMANQLFQFDWLLKNFGQQMFFNGGFAGFGASFTPLPSFGALDAAGLSLLTQFSINSAFLDVNQIAGIAGGFLGNAGLDLFNQFSFQNSGISSFLLKE